MNYELQKWQIEQIEERLAESESGEAKHFNHEDVAKWLSSWGSDNEQTFCC